MSHWVHATGYVTDLPRPLWLRLTIAVLLIPIHLPVIIICIKTFLDLVMKAPGA